MSSLSRHSLRSSRSQFSPLSRSATSGSYLRFGARLSPLTLASSGRGFGEPELIPRLVKPGLLDRSQPALTRYHE